jgi:hypothetical protein
MPWEHFLKKNYRTQFRFYLWTAKLIGKKFIYFPTGCTDSETKTEFSKLDNSNICNNCGWEKCPEQETAMRLNLIRNYVDMAFGRENFVPTKEYPFRPMHYKSLDLSLWNPDLEIPEQFQLPKTDKIRIIHSFLSKNREHRGKNIKGSPAIMAAIEKLQNEGFEIEYVYINNVESKNMRFYQVQADIVVEQLIVGWWGSTGIETMALGKPVICYLRPSWKKAFFDFFPEIASLPIIEADTRTIYDVLKETIANKTFRVQKAKESRAFSQKYYDVKKNIRELEEAFLKL